MIFRKISEEENFTTLPNKLLNCGNSAQPREDTLSPAALGLLCYLLSNSEKWIVTGTVIASHFQITKNKVTKLTDELKDAGYIRRSHYFCDKKQTTLPNWDVSSVPDNWDPDYRDREYGDLTSINQEQRLSEKQTSPSKREVFLTEAPAGIAVTAWRKWWEYKLGPRGRAPEGQSGKTKVTRVTNEFRVLVQAGAGAHALEKIVDHHIAMGWRSLGDPTWKFSAGLLKGSQMLKGVE